MLVRNGRGAPLEKMRLELELELEELGHPAQSSSRTPPPRKSKDACDGQVNACEKKYNWECASI